MSGPDRALCYRLAVASGLRYSELGSSTLESEVIGGDDPSVTILAAYSKNGQTATLPLAPEMAVDLGKILSRTPRGTALFRLPHDEGAEMLRFDLD